MLKIVSTNKFNKDLAQAIKRGFNIAKLKQVIDILAKEEHLDQKYKDHALLGKYHEFRECHIESDWLLVYRVNHEELELFLFRTGTHSDLFK